jgi:hypothetical protein
MFLAVHLVQSAKKLDTRKKNGKLEYRFKIIFFGSSMQGRLYLNTKRDITSEFGKGFLYRRK